MIQEIGSKTELETMAAKLETEVIQLTSDVSSLNTKLNNLSNYDGINVSGAASTLKNNLTNLSSDLEAIATSIKLYSATLNNFDVDDFKTTDIEKELNKVPSTQTPPASETLNSTAPSPSNPSTGNSYTDPGTTTSPGTNDNNSNSNNSNNSSNNNNSNPGNTNAPIVNGGTPATNKPTDNKTDITERTVIETKGKKSSNGLTQQSAKQDIIIEPGDPNNPNIDVTKYHNNIANGFEVTTGNLTYQLCDEDIELLCAIVSAESDKSYDDALAVISTILNRCERSNWIASHGRDPIQQATAPNQYVVYQHGSYKTYLNGKAPDTVKQAVMDALNGVRNHNYCSFRSNGTTSYSNNMITSTGNRYK
jgi:hypothetical protein